MTNLLLTNPFSYVIIRNGSGFIILGGGCLVSVDNIGKQNANVLHKDVLFELIKTDLKRLVKDKHERKCIIEAIKVLCNIEY